MLERVWRKGSPPTPLVGMQTSTAAMENSVEISWKLQIELPYDPAIPLLGIHTEETRSERDTCTPMFITAMFIIARTWKQPRCPSADEWIRKLWYIYTMEYYSSIKKNPFELVLMRWMKLEPIIQSEVSQKDKDQYSIVMHINWILKDGNDNPTCKTEKETQMYRTDCWTLWEKARVGWFERTACILSRVKQITSPGGMHETSARAWCTGKTQRDWVEREVGGGIRVGNTCKSMADSCQCMTRPTAVL